MRAEEIVRFLACSTEERGASRRQTAKLIGSTYENVCRCRGGHGNTRLDTAVRWAEIEGMELVLVERKR